MFFFCYACVSLELCGLKACGFHLPVANWTETPDVFNVSWVSKPLISPAVIIKSFALNFFIFIPDISPHLDGCFWAHHMQINRHESRHAVMSHQKLANHRSVTYSTITRLLFPELLPCWCHMMSQHFVARRIFMELHFLTLEMIPFK